MYNSKWNIYKISDPYSDCVYGYSDGGYEIYYHKGETANGSTQLTLEQ